jgi:hypothetical protein
VSQADGRNPFVERFYTRLGSMKRGNFENSQFPFDTFTEHAILGLITCERRLASVGVMSVRAFCSGRFALSSCSAWSSDYDRY